MGKAFKTRNQAETVKAGEVEKRALKIGASSVTWRPSEFEPEKADHLLGQPTKTLKTVRRKSVIDTMAKRGQLDDERYRRLAYYREQALLADRSPVKSCLDRTVKSGGDIGLSAAIVSAILATARMERDMGPLWALARAVAVDDKSLTEWCVSQHGGRERYDGAGKFVAIVPAHEVAVMKLAMLDLKVAADRIVTC